MKYLMLIYGNQEIWSGVTAEDFTQLVSQVDAFNQALQDSGEMVLVEGLVERARAFRAPQGTPVMSDGPYLEAKEYVGSMFIVDVDSEARALEIAAAYPALKWCRKGGGVEVWPLMEHGAGDV